MLFTFTVYADSSFVDDGPGAAGYRYRVDVGRTLVKTNRSDLNPYYVLESTYTDANGVTWYDTAGVKNTQISEYDGVLQTYVDIDTDDSTRKQLIYYAFQKLGNPYSYGCMGPTYYDCSGFTRYCYSSVGVSIPRSSGSICAIGTHIAKEQLTAGDIVGTNGHVGVYIGNGCFIHAQDRGSGVVTDYLDIYNSKSYRPFTVYINNLN